jgi:hypothetical protein
MAEWDGSVAPMIICVLCPAAKNLPILAGFHNFVVCLPHRAVNLNVRLRGRQAI